MLTVAFIAIWWLAWTVGACDMHVQLRLTTIPAATTFSVIEVVIVF